MDSEHKTQFITNIDSQVNDILKKHNLEHMFKDKNASNLDVSINKKDTLNIKFNDNNMLCTYEHLGSMDVVTRTWFWAWGYIISNKKATLSKKITSNIKKMMNDKKLQQIDIEHLNFFTQNSIHLSKYNLNNLIKICIVASKNDAVFIVPHVITQKNVPTKINFYIITKIIQIENN